MAKSFVDKIRLAYGNFIKAHLTYLVVRSKAPELLAQKIVERYKHSLELLNVEDFRSRFVEKMSDILFLVETYHMVAYRLGYSRTRCIATFKTDVDVPLREHYTTVQTADRVSDENYNFVKDFTATLLLKIEHLNFVMFNYKILSQNVANPFVEGTSNKTFYSQIYQELFDNMVLIPMKCINLFLLKNCVYFHVNKLLKYINKKYQLKLKTQGWYIHNYIKGVLKDFIDNGNKLIWGNFTLFKNYFYQNLFAVQENFKQNFFLRDTPEIDELEDLIQTKIETNSKIEAALNNVLIDQLQHQLYNKMLEIKGRFNNQAPLKSNMVALDNIVNQLDEFLDEFKQSNIGKLNDNFLKLLKEIAEVVDRWYDNV